MTLPGPLSGECGVHLSPVRCESWDKHELEVGAQQGSPVSLGPGLGEVRAISLAEAAASSATSSLGPGSAGFLSQVPLSSRGGKSQCAGLCGQLCSEISSFNIQIPGLASLPLCRGMDYFLLDRYMI